MTGVKNSWVEAAIFVGREGFKNVEQRQEVREFLWTLEGFRRWTDSTHGDPRGKPVPVVRIGSRA